VEKLKQVPWFMWAILVPVIPLMYYASHIIDGQESVYGDMITTLVHAFYPIGIIIFLIHLSNIVLPCVFIEKKLQKVDGGK
jgi:hypothetical protein